jgi:DME family drug/metabolite transporter
MLWSTSGAFVKNFSLPGVTIAMYRSLAAGLALLLIVRVRRVSPTWQGMMIAMVATFAIMSAMFVVAVTKTTAANAILLQYTAPFWMLLASVLFLGEAVDRKSLWAVMGAMIGIAILLAGQWHSEEDHRLGMLLGLGSGVTYAAIAIFLRMLRAHDPTWLAFLNHFGAGVLMFVGIAAGIFAGAWSSDLLWPTPSAGELAMLTVFGVTQMAAPYVLFGMGLRSVSPQEAGILTLAEPLLNPLWTFLAAGETPSSWTVAGGSILMAMLLIRYIPRRRGAARMAADGGTG